MAVALRVGPTADERCDHDLVAAVRRGEDEAFECLYDRYRRRIATFIYGMVGDWARAEDITQDVFISALRRMRETERPIAFKPWIYEIAKNACIDNFRRARRAEEVSFDAEEGLGSADYHRLADSRGAPDAAMERKEEMHDLVGAFGSLSQSHHEILVLRELEGLSYRQIGERMGLSRPSVESTLFRARRRLTEEYDDLKTGRRCQRVQAAISASVGATIGAREHGRIARHVAHCQPCRRHAVSHGAVGLLEGGGRRSVPARVAALLPIPAFLRRSRSGTGSSATQTAGLAAGRLPATAAELAAQITPALQSSGSGWGRMAATGLAVLATAGAGVATQSALRHAFRSSPAPAQSATAATASDRALDSAAVLRTVSASSDLSVVALAHSPAQTSAARARAKASRRHRMERRAAASLAGSLLPGVRGGRGGALRVLQGVRPSGAASGVNGATTISRGPAGSALRGLAPATRHGGYGNGSGLARLRGLVHHVLGRHGQGGSTGSSGGGSSPQSGSQPSSSPPSSSGSSSSGSSSQPSTTGSSSGQPPSSDPQPPASSGSSPSSG
jgi:RNA polymerase sigma factor (sigma-70 family)